MVSSFRFQYTILCGYMPYIALYKGATNGCNALKNQNVDAKEDIDYGDGYMLILLNGVLNRGE